MKSLYFYHAFKMDQTAVENSLQILSKNWGSKLYIFISPNASPKIMKFNKGADSFIIYNFSIMNFHIKCHLDGLKHVQTLTGNPAKEAIHLVLKKHT